MSDIVQSKFESLKQIIDSDTLLDAQRAESLINDLKLEFYQHQFEEKQNNREISLESKILFRDILEYDALFSIKTKKFEEFERAMAQLKCYYFRDIDLPPSENMPLLLAVHLVALLATTDSNKTQFVDFNIELQLARNLIGDNEYLNYAADLYQSVNENSFARLFLLENQPPSPLFNQIIEGLLKCARNSHADSIQRAYKSLTLSEISSILHFNDEDETRQFVQEKGWKLEDDEETVVFNLKEDQQKSKEDMFRLAIALSEKISTLA